MRLAKTGRHHDDGRNGPQVAMVGSVIGGIGIRDMKAWRVVVVVRMLAHVVVGEVPEDADRLRRDQHHDCNQHDNGSPVGRETSNHRHSLSPRTIRRCAL